MRLPIDFPEICQRLGGIIERKSTATPDSLL
jgi:hypothetical protein